MIREREASPTARIAAARDGTAPPRPVRGSDSDGEGTSRAVGGRSRDQLTRITAVARDDDGSGDEEEEGEGAERRCEKETVEVGWFAYL